jgi:hypothetical protein
VSFEDDDRTESVLRDFNAESLMECSGNRRKGWCHLRFSVSSWRTGADELKTPVAAIDGVVDSMR